MYDYNIINLPPSSPTKYLCCGEKGLHHWGRELDTETTPLEAGLGFALDMNKVPITYF